MSGNPWKVIPLEDYEGHMSLPSVGQAALLGDVLEAAVQRYRPTSVGVIGVAGGNGLERVDPSCVRCIIGVDINEKYVETAKQRYGHAFHESHFIVADIQQSSTLKGIPKVELAYAALLFEYVDVQMAVASCCDMITDEGVFCTVLQLPTEGHHKVSPSPFVSLQLLQPVMRLVDPDTLLSTCTQHGLTLVEHREAVSPSGKRFAVQTFQRKQHKFP